MLVLTRKKGESILLGADHEIVVTMLKIRGDKVAIGIDAPKNHKILRSELYEAWSRDHDGLPGQSSQTE